MDYKEIDVKNIEININTNLGDDKQIVFTKDLLYVPNYSSSKFDMSNDKGTVFLVKIGDKYEQIARIKSKSNGNHINFFQKIKSELSSKVSD